MEKNTVLLDIELYNELRDFKQKIEEGYTYDVGSWSFPDRYISTDEAVKEMADKIGNRAEEIEDLREYIEQLKKEIDEKDKEISDLKQVPSVIGKQTVFSKIKKMFGC